MMKTKTIYFNERIRDDAVEKSLNRQSLVVVSQLFF